jgi:outer membrane protein TolC
VLPPAAASITLTRRQAFPVGGVTTNVPFAQTFYSGTVGATSAYTLFNGYQIANRTRQAESQVDAARETLRVIEQQVLFDAATAYMNLLRDAAIHASLPPTRIISTIFVVLELAFEVVKQ